MTPIFLRPTVRPFLILVGVVLLLAAIDAGNGRILTVATAYSALQSFSTFALVALGLGLTMLIGEFDYRSQEYSGLRDASRLQPAPKMPTSDCFAPSASAPHSASCKGS